MQKIPRVEEEVGVAGDPQRLRPCGPKERGERLKGTESPRHLLDLELRPEATRYGGEATSSGRRRVSCPRLGPTPPRSATRHCVLLGK